MKKILPIVLILIGIAEIVVAVLGVKMPIFVAIVMGVVFIALGVKTLIDIGKN